MGLSDDVGDDELDAPPETPVEDCFGHIRYHMDSENCVNVDITSDVLWDGDDPIRIAYLSLDFEGFRMAVHLEEEDARSVAVDILEAVNAEVEDA